MERDGSVAPLNELLAVSTLTLATVGSDGVPHAAPVYFAASPELNFYFFSDANSQHVRDIAHDPHTAAALYPACFDWRDIRGIQMRGLARLVNSPAEWESAWNLYQSKFPFVSALREIVARNQLYCFFPTWIRLLDNSRGLGFKQEWHLK